MFPFDIIQRIKWAYKEVGQAIETWLAYQEMRKNNQEGDKDEIDKTKL